MNPIIVDRPWLEFALQSRIWVLSWAINRPGFVEADRIVWREVGNAELPRELNVENWLESELASCGWSDAVAFLTAHDVRSYCEKTVNIGTTVARAVATVGLLNSERVGHRQDWSGQDWGTINVTVEISNGLSIGGYA